MLINLRNALMAGRRLPYDAEVEYLESMGTQWIDTGVPANGEFDVEYTIQTPSTFNRVFVVGGARSSTQHLNFGQYDPNRNFILAYLGDYWVALQSISANTIYTTKVHYASGSQTATVNGGSVYGRTYTGTEALNLNIYLFKRNFYGATDTILPMIGRMYSFKIYQNGVLVRDFIPVRKGTTGYLYDRVSGKLFGNAGTGDFVLGPDVVQVEYIESHGTEWIDLGAVVSPDTDFQFKGTIVSDNTNGCAFGESARFSWAANNPAYALALATGGGYAYLRYGDSSANAIGVTMVGLNTPFTASLIGQDFSINGLKVATVSRINSFSSTVQTMSLFKRNNMDTNSTYSIIKIESLNFGNKFHLLPVRVGTEGATMDTLTRRIYRNQGTGAFTYGNDLKYPIPA